MHRRILLLALLVVLCACAPKRLSDLGTARDPSRASAGDGLPPGVVIDPAQRGQVEIDGLFPAKPGDRTCCWVATRARLTVRKREPATYLDLSIYVPDYPFFQRRPQALSLTIDGTAASARCCFGPGVYTLRFALPARLRVKNGTLPLSLRSKYAFVPSHERVNSDSRELGVVVTRVDFRS